MPQFVRDVENGRNVPCENFKITKKNVNPELSSFKLPLHNNTKRLVKLGNELRKKPKLGHRFSDECVLEDQIKAEKDLIKTTVVVATGKRQVAFDGDLPPLGDKLFKSRSERKSHKSRSDRPRSEKPAVELKPAAELKPTAELRPRADQGTAAETIFVDDRPTETLPSLVTVKTENADDRTQIAPSDTDVQCTLIEVQPTLESDDAAAADEGANDYERLNERLRLVTAEYEESQHRDQQLLQPATEPEPVSIIDQSAPMYVKIEPLDDSFSRAKPHSSIAIDITSDNSPIDTSPGFNDIDQDELQHAGQSRTPEKQIPDVAAMDTVMPSGDSPSSSTAQNQQLSKADPSSSQPHQLPAEAGPSSSQVAEAGPPSSQTSDVSIAGVGNLKAITELIANLTDGGGSAAPSNPEQLLEYSVKGLGDIIKNLQSIKDSSHEAVAEHTDNQQPAAPPK